MGPACTPVDHDRMGSSLRAALAALKAVRCGAGIIAALNLGADFTLIGRAYLGPEHGLSTRSSASQEIFFGQRRKPGYGRKH